MRMNKTFAIAAVLIAALALSGCGRAQANKQTLVTNDCGVNWRLIPAGNSVPAAIGFCSYTVTVPDYPMQGDTKFKTSFKNRVLATVAISYDYSITDGLAFIKEAKYLGRSNSDANDETNATPYETAENIVIDKRMRDIAGELLREQDIVEFDQGVFEDVLLEKLNEQLKSRGVKVNTLAFVPTPEEQTRLAIDVATAMRVYEAAGLAAEGRQIAIARAGAPHISTQVTSAVPATSED